MANQKYCYDCEHCYSSHFCGWTSYGCKIYGSLDIDQQERHPDKTANTCPKYKKVRDCSNEFEQSNKEFEEYCKRIGKINV